MFTEEGRSHLLAELIDHARTDDAVDAAALVGSAAGGTLDRWSDIDLALGLSDSAEVQQVCDRWTAELGAAAGVADTLDVWAGPTLYRVFLLDDSLQVDISFWPAGTLAQSGSEPFAVIFGEAAAPTVVDPPRLRAIMGWGWLYALHARAAIARGRLWQAVRMLDGVRDQGVALSCHRHGLPAHHGRGADQLPDDLLAALARTLPTELSPRGLGQAFDAALDFLANEAEQLDQGLAGRLRTPFADLRTTADPAAPEDGGARAAEPTERPRA